MAACWRVPADWQVTKPDPIPWFLAPGIANYPFPNSLALLKLWPMKLDEWLKQADTTKAKFARALDISAGRISQLLAGDTPSLDLAVKIQILTRDKVKPADFSPHLEGDHDMSSSLDTVASAIAAIKAGGRRRPGK
jgi:predicted XRE-type DNA-binding protein